MCEGRLEGKCRLFAITTVVSTAMWIAASMLDLGVANAVSLGLLLYSYNPTELRQQTPRRRQIAPWRRLTMTPCRKIKLQSGRRITGKPGLPKPGCSRILR